MSGRTSQPWVNHEYDANHASVLYPSPASHTHRPKLEGTGAWLFEEERVNCIPFPNTEQNQTKSNQNHKLILWVKPMRAQLIVTRSALLTKWNLKKRQELKFIAAHTHTQNTKKADPQLCSTVEKRTISCNTHNQETLFFSVQLCTRNLGPGSRAGAVFLIPAFCLLPQTTARWTRVSFFLCT